MSECDEIRRLRVAEGCAEWHPSCYSSPPSPPRSSRLFPLRILFIHAPCNCISILHDHYLQSLLFDCNTIHLQTDGNGFSFYMQSTSMKWLSESDLQPRRILILYKGSYPVICDVYIPICWKALYVCNAAFYKVKSCFVGHLQWKYFNFRFISYLGFLFFSAHCQLSACLRCHIVVFKYFVIYFICFTV